MDLDFNHFHNKAAKGNANAQYQLGFLYLNGEGVEKNAYEAVKWFRLAAEQGYLPAIYYLGLCYSDGEGVNQDKEESVFWLQKAAIAGYDKAQYSLALMYEEGEGVEVDFEEAEYWYSKAAEQDNEDAIIALGDLIELQEDVERELEDEANEIIASYSIAERDYLLAMKTEIVDKNYEKAFELYRQSAEQGSAKAKYSLWTCYSEGIGVAKNEDEAYKWLLDAACDEYPEAQYTLGCIWGKGTYNTRVDLIEAEYWFRLAAEQGHTKAIDSLKK